MTPTLISILSTNQGNRLMQSRISMVLVSMIFFVEGLVNGDSPTAIYDPTRVRTLFVIGAFSVVILSYLSKFIANYIQFLQYSMGFVILCWVGGLFYINHSSSALLSTTLAAYIMIGWFLTSYELYKIVCIGFTLIIILLVAMRPPSEANSVALCIQVVLYAGFSFSITLYLKNSREQLESILHEKQMLITQLQLKEAKLDQNVSTALRGNLKDKIAIKRLFRDKEFLEVLLNDDNLGLWSINLENDACYFSSVWKKMLGYEDDELNDTIENYFGLMPEEDRPVAQEMYQSYKIGERTRSVAIRRFCHKNGSILYFKVNAVVEQDEQKRNVRLVGTFEDVSSQVIREQEREKSAMMFENIFQQSSDALLLFDTDMKRIVRYNHKAMSLLRPKMPQEMLNENLLQSLHFGYESLFLQIKNSIDAQKNWNDVIQITNFRNEKYWVNAHISKLNIGQEAFHLVCLTDISQIKEQEAKIQAQQVDLRALLDNNDTYIWMVDQDYNLIEYNLFFGNKILSLTGKALQKGQPITFALGDTHYKNIFFERYEKVFQGITIVESMPISIGEMEMYAEVHMHPVYSEGEVSRVVVFLNDITEHQKALETIERNEQLILSVNQNIADGLYRCDADGKLIYINESFARMFGYEVEEMKATVTFPMLYENIERRGELIHLLDSFGLYKNEEVAYRKKNGEKFWGMLSVRMTLLDDGGIFYDGVVRDITELRNARVQLQEQNSALQKVNAELDRFAYSVSHEMRSPLTSVMGLISILKYAKNEEEKERYIDLMNSSINKLDNFIQDTLNLSRNARLELTASQLSWKQAITETVAKYAFSDAAVGIDIQQEISQEGDFFTDTYRLQLILDNLISNAIRYADKGKVLPFVRIYVHSDAESATVRVEDNGIGIAEEHLNRVFEMFFRASAARPGTGLGLYILKDVVDKLDGKVEVKSKLGEGTTFQVTILNMKQASPVSAES